MKPVHTLDLVVLAAEWGHGRRRGWLSNLHLGARDPAAAAFVMVGKTFKGLTDALLAWQTAEFLARESARPHPHVVEIDPPLVVEIALDGVQASTRYPGGVALRFARVRRYRDDKDPADADTIEAVRAMLAGAGAAGAGSAAPQWPGRWPPGRPLADAEDHELGRLHGATPTRPPGGRCRCRPGSWWCGRSARSRRRPAAPKQGRPATRRRGTRFHARRPDAHSASALGSNTAHWVPLSIDRSRYRSSGGR